MTNVPINAKVQCTDGPCGHSTNVIINPVTRKVTHFALREKSLPDNPTRLVPVSMVAEVTPKQIVLKCNRAIVAADMPPFTITHFVAQSDLTTSTYHSGQAYHSDYMVHDYEAGSPYSASRFRQVTPKSASDYATVEEEGEAVPEGELEVHSGMYVHASDGKMGKLDALVLDPESGEITHILMREGHLWGKKDVCIPVTAVKYTDGDSVHIELDKAAVHELPTVPVK